MFSFETYRELLKTLKNDFIFTFFEDYSQKKRIFLRHDVDIFIENVLNMATIENELDIRSTYFLQPNCEFYNILSNSAVKIINSITDLGHKIGLHIDASNISSKEELESHINGMFDFFSKYLPLSKVVSFHKPSPFVMIDMTLPGFINVYEKKYFKDIRYFSDSKRRNFLSTLMKSLENDKDTSIQLLIHPYWWDYISMDIWEAWERYKKVKLIFLRKSLKDFEPYRKLFDYRFKGE